MFMRNLFIVVFVLLLLTACEFTAPSWITTLRLPLLNEDYPIINLTTTDNIDADDYVMYFYTDGIIENASIGEARLRISPNAEGSGPIPLASEHEEGSTRISIVDGESGEGEDYDVRIVYATVLNGFLNFHFSAVTENVATVIVTFAEILDDADEPLVVAIDPHNLPPNNIHAAPLHGYKFTDLERPGIALEELRFTVEVVLVDGVSWGSINSTQGYMRIYYDSPIFFSNIYGWLESFRVDALDSITDIELDYPINIENAVHLNRPELVFVLNNYVGFETAFEATVTAFNTRGESLIYTTIEVDGMLKQAIEPGLPTQTTLRFGPEVGVDKLMSIAPDRIEITNAFFVIDQRTGAPGFASVGLAYAGDYRATVPFDFTFRPNQPVMPKELTEVNITGNNREDIERHAQGVVMHFTLRNYYTLGARIILFFSSSDDHYLVYNTESIFTDGFSRLVLYEDRYGQPLHLYAGNIDIPFERSLSISLGREYLPIFYRHETIYFGMQIIFDEGHAEIDPRERIQVISSIEASILVEF